MRTVCTIAWLVNAAGYMIEAWKPHWDTEDGWIITAMLTSGALMWLGMIAREWAE